MADIDLLAVESAANKMIEEAIYHGGDAGGPYFSNSNDLFVAMIEFAMIFGFDVIMADDCCPTFHKRGTTDD